MNDKTKSFEERFVEAGADLEHDRWARWQKWCHKVLRENCPSPELEKVLERWDRQIATSYTDLSEEEKESDRKETRNYLPLVRKEILSVIDSFEMEGREDDWRKIDKSGMVKSAEAISIANENEIYNSAAKETNNKVKQLREKYDA